MRQKISFLDSAILISIILLAIHMLFRFIDLATVIRFFPFDYINDLTSYLGQLYFLDVCGYHQFCPYWYNGFTTFLVTPPGWYFFAYPFYLLTQHLTLSFYLSIAALFFLALVACLFFGKKFHFSRIRSLALFFFLFGNAINIGNFLRLGRVHALLNFVLFITFFFLLWLYKDRKLDSFFFLSSVLYSFMIVTHYQETVLAGLFFASFFLYRSSLKDRMKIIVAMILAVFFASWWLFDFVATLGQSSLLAFHEGKRALDFQSDRLIINILTYLLPLAFTLIFFLYWKIKQRSSKELLFFLPSLILAFLYFFRLHSFIPVLRNISQDPYILFFFFQALFLLFLIFDSLKLSWQKLLGIFILVVTLFSILANLFITPYFVQHTSLDEEMKSVLSHATGPYLILPPLEAKVSPLYSKGHYTYGAIYYNLSTPDGWSPPIASLDYLENLDSFYKASRTLSCSALAEQLSFFNATNIVTYQDTCERLASCNFTGLFSTEHLCLYTGFSSI